MTYKSHESYLPKSIYIGITFLLISLSAFSQTSELDSLKALIPKAITDEEKIDLYLKISVKSRGVNPDQLIEYADKAYNLAEKLKDYKSMGKALARKGRSYMDQANYNSALKIYYQSLELYEANSYKEGIADTYNRIGNVYLYLNSDNKTLEYYKKALDLYKEIKDYEGIALASNNIGLVYQQKNDQQKALEYFSEALEIEEEKNNSETARSIIHNMGISFFMLKDYKKALDYFLKATKVNQEVDDKNGYARALVGLAETYQAMERYSQALTYFNKSLKIAVEIGDKELLKSIYLSLSATNKASGNYKVALENYELYNNIKDSIFNIERSRQVTEMETKYQTEKKEKDIQLLSQQNEKQSLLRNILIVFFVLIMGFTYWWIRTKQKANKKIAEAYEIIAEKNKNITDSINYAKKIQLAILPSNEIVSQALPESFILYKPKDVVSGDFYFFSKKGEKLIIAAVDCTGHGVPGAFMSVLGNEQLNQIIDRGVTQPDEVLNQLNRNIKNALKQSDKGSQSRDGMDIALCCINTTTNTIEFSGANRPLYIFNGELKEIKPDKMAIGGTTDDSYSFTSHTLNILRNETIYLFSDGFADQFGGPKSKKFMSKSFKNLLAEIHQKPMPEQKEILNNAFENWKGTLEQVDDVVVIGMRL